MTTDSKPDARLAVFQTALKQVAAQLGIGPIRLKPGHSEQEILGEVMTTTPDGAFTVRLWIEPQWSHYYATRSIPQGFKAKIGIVATHGFLLRTPRPVWFEVKADMPVATLVTRLVTGYRQIVAAETTRRQQAAADQARQTRLQTQALALIGAPLDVPLPPKGYDHLRLTPVWANDTMTAVEFRIHLDTYLAPAEAQAVRDLFLSFAKNRTAKRRAGRSDA